MMEVLPIGPSARSSALSLLQRSSGNRSHALNLYFSGDASVGHFDVSETAPAAALKNASGDEQCLSQRAKPSPDLRPATTANAEKRGLALAFPSSKMTNGTNTKKRQRTPTATPASTSSPLPVITSSSVNNRVTKPPQLTMNSQAVVGPLAERVRPKTLSEFVGQVAFKNDSSLGKLLLADRFPSSILWGPPGCGKTTVANIVAKQTKRQVIRLSATQAGVKEVRSLVDKATKRRALNASETGSFLFLDEIHRWNKAQQDALLPHVESGLVTLVGATTENPSFSLNKALLSRCKVITMDRLDRESLVALLKGALTNPASGLPKNVKVPEKILLGLATVADGDARQALNALELAISMSKNPEKEDGVSNDKQLIEVSISSVEKALQRTHLLYDRDGEEHYNIISALHKSMRASEVDASLYWLARMLEAGEDPRYVTRRLVRFASEDIGLADPNALLQASAAHRAVEKLGMPESDVVIAQAVVYCARAPKSVAIYRAYKAAKELVKEGPGDPVPLHIRNAPTGLMKKLGYGKEYTYPPDKGYARGPSDGLSFFPDKLKGTRFFDKEDVEPGHKLH